MKKLLSLLLLIPLQAYSAGIPSPENIDCFKNPRNTTRAVYSLEPLGSNDANLVYPTDSYMVVEEWEEQREDDPDFFNSGKCIRVAEGSPIYQFCGSEKPAVNGLTAIRDYTRRNYKVIYCEPEISAYAQGVHSF